MQHRRYSKDNIKDFRRQYKFYRWLNYLFIIVGILILIFGRYLLPSFTDSMGYYKGGSYNYICDLNDIIMLITIFPCYILAFILYQLNLKSKLKDQYKEYEVSCFNRNLDRYKRFKIKIFSAIFLILTVFILALHNYNDLTRITLNDSNIYIKYDKYNINGSYKYDDFSQWSTSLNNYNVMLSLSDDRGEKFSALLVDLGEHTKSQDKLLKLLDEKTDYKFLLYNKTKDEIKNNLLR